MDWDAFFRKFKKKWVYSQCYNRQEDVGHAIFGCCDSTTSAEKGTGYLQYGCLDCPYRVDYRKLEGKIR